MGRYGRLCLIDRLTGRMVIGLIRSLGGSHLTKLITGCQIRQMDLGVRRNGGVNTIRMKTGQEQKRGCSSFLKEVFIQLPESPCSGDSLLVRLAGPLGHFGTIVGTLGAPVGHIAEPSGPFGGDTGGAIRKPSGHFWDPSMENMGSIAMDPMQCNALKI